MINKGSNLLNIVKLSIYQKSPEPIVVSPSEMKYRLVARAVVAAKYKLYTIEILCCQSSELYDVEIVYSTTVCSTLTPQIDTKWCAKLIFDPKIMRSKRKIMNVMSPTTLI